jgi:hypothetical protein
MNLLREWSGRVAVLVALVVTGLAAAPTAAQDLFISEYAEGSSNNKYLEIYNPTSETIDLDGYAFPNVNGDPTTVGAYEYWNTFTSGATIAAGAVYIIAHGSADQTILDKADQTHNYLSNGDDGYALVKGTESDFVVIDWLGDWDADPGSGWDVAGVTNGTQDHTLIRKPGFMGNTDWTASAGTNADDSEWIVKDKDDWADLGKHAFADAPARDGYTIRDINAISADSISILNAGGETLDGAIVPSLIYNGFLDSTEVTITAVIMSDPLSSGLSNVTDGVVDRVHVFVRDTASVTLGNAGMGIQVVDGAYETTGMLNYLPGDVVTIKGAITPFGNTMQISPTSISLVGFYEDLGLPASILEPEVITTADANKAVGTDGVQTNWSNWSDLRGQFVKVENAVVVARSVANPDRPDFYISTDDGATVLNFYDTSLSFRNDRSAEYPASFNVQDDDFVPPPVGAKINLSGYLVMQGGADQIGRSVPENAIVSIVPFEREHLEYLDSPPVVTGLTKPDFVPTTEDVTVSFNATVDATTTVADVSLYYSTSDAIGETKITATEAGGNGAYTATIPAQSDGVFVTYYVSATDGRGFTTKSESQSIRFLTGGITQIAQIQETADGGMGDSPFAGVTTDMNINAVVTSMQDSSGILMIQDDAELAPWTGVFVYQPSATELALGTQLNITSATVGERYGVTQLTDLTYTVTGTGKPYNYKVVPTTALTDDATAEAHEGMRLGFEDVTIIKANANYGEWSFSSTGDATGAIKADDQSAGIASDFNVSTFTDGMTVGFIRGLGWYSFGEFKLVPETTADICVADCAPINPPNTVAYDILFAVDMSVAKLGGRFNDAEDVVTVAGSFNGWSTTTDTLLQDFQNPDLYTALVAADLEVPSTVMYKFVIGKAADATPQGWESGNDRQLPVTGQEETPELTNLVGGAAPYYDRVGPDMILSEETTFTFEVDARPVYYYLADNGRLPNDTQTGDPVDNFTSLYVNGPLAGNADGLGDWATWGPNDLGQLPSRQLVDDGTGGDAVAGDSVYTVQLTFSAGTPNMLVGKYGTDGYDNEGGFGADHRFPLDPAMTTLRTVYGGILGADGKINDANGPTNPEGVGDWDKYILISPDSLEAVAVKDDEGKDGDEDAWSIVTDIEGSEVPTTFALYAAYPNPFNPSAQIRFDVAEAGQVSLQVFDLLGRHVATLQDGMLTAGQHKVTFEASDLPSGTYIYRMQAAGKVLTKTMVLVK